MRHILLPLTLYPCGIALAEPLDRSAFCYYDINLRDFRVEAGSSSRDLKLSQTLNIDLYEETDDCRRPADYVDGRGAMASCGRPY